MVPRVSFDVLQMQKAQPEAPRLPSVCQADQQVSDQLVLIVEKRTVAIARLARTERSAGECDADPLIYGLGGHPTTMRWPRHFFPRASFSRSARILTSANMRFNRLFSRAHGATTSSSSGCGGRSNMKRSTGTPMPASQTPARALVGISPSTTQGGRIHRWTGRRPIRHISTRRHQSQWRYNREGNPLKKRLDTVQTNRTTSPVTM